MKLRVMTLYIMLVALLSAPSFAIGSSQKSHQSAKKTIWETDDLNMQQFIAAQIVRLTSCTREIVEKRVNGLDGLSYAYSLLKKFRETQSDKERILILPENCDQFVADGVPYLGIGQQRQIDHLAEIATSITPAGIFASIVINNFIHPDYYCIANSHVRSAGLVFGASLINTQVTCLGTNGRVEVYLAPPSFSTHAIVGIAISNSWTDFVLRDVDPIKKKIQVKQLFDVDVQLPYSKSQMSLAFNDLITRGEADSESLEIIKGVWIKKESDLHSIGTADSVPFKVNQTFTRVLSILNPSLDRAVFLDALKESTKETSN
jgi:hypothetical protein